MSDPFITSTIETKRKNHRQHRDGVRKAQRATRTKLNGNNNNGNWADLWGVTCLTCDRWKRTTATIAPLQPSPKAVSPRSELAMLNTNEPLDAIEKHTTLPATTIQRRSRKASERSNRNPELDAPHAGAVRSPNELRSLFRRPRPTPQKQCKSCAPRGTCSVPDAPKRIHKRINEMGPPPTTNHRTGQLGRRRVSIWGSEPGVGRRNLA